MRKDVDPKILEAANAYVGFPQEVDEDIATTMKRNGFVDGAVWRQGGLWKDAQGEHHDVQTYDKGGWNMPDIMYWLDLNLPKDYDGNKT